MLETPCGGSIIEKIKEISEVSVEDAIALTGSLDAYEKVVTISAKMLPRSVSRLNTLIGEDLSLYSIEAHGIKSVLKSIGAKKLSLLALELEEMSKNAQTDNFIEKHTAFCEQASMFLECLSVACRKEAPQKTEKGSARFLKSRLPALKDLILNFNQSAAVEEITVLSKKHYGETVDDALAGALSALEYFNYDEAAQIIGALDEEI